MVNKVAIASYALQNTSIGQKVVFSVLTVVTVGIVVFHYNKEKILLAKDILFKSVPPQIYRFYRRRHPLDPPVPTQVLQEKTPVGSSPIKSNTFLSTKSLING